MTLPSWPRRKKNTYMAQMGWLGSGFWVLFSPQQCFTYKLCAAENYDMTTVTKYIHGIWPSASEKNTYMTLPSWPGRKKIHTWEWLLAQHPSCHVIIFISAKNYDVVKFGQEPDALRGTSFGPGSRGKPGSDQVQTT